MEELKELTEAYFQLALEKEIKEEKASKGGKQAKKRGAPGKFKYNTPLHQNTHIGHTGGSRPAAQKTAVGGKGQPAGKSWLLHCIQIVDNVTIHIETDKDTDGSTEWPTKKSK